MNADDIKMCNCAGCGRDAYGESMRKWYYGHSRVELTRMPPLITGRVKERPYCKGCLSSTMKSPSTGGRSGPLEDDSPWQQNVVRELEDG